MNSWRVILATMVIFGAGVVTGGLLVRHTQAARPNRPAPDARRLAPMSPAGLRLEFMRRMERELDLNPDQRDRIEKLLKESQDRSRKLMAPIAPELTAELEKTKAEFRDVLTPEQRARFDELLKRPQHGRDQKRPTSARDRGTNFAMPTNAVKP